MVVESLHAHIAVVAVGSASWPIDETLVTELEPEGMGFSGGDVGPEDVPHLLGFVSGV